MFTMENKEHWATKMGNSDFPHRLWKELIRPQDVKRKKE
jgi:hypothetical protein